MLNEYVILGQLFSGLCRLRLNTLSPFTPTYSTQVGAVHLNKIILKTPVNDFWWSIVSEYKLVEFSVKVRRKYGESDFKASRKLKFSKFVLSNNLPINQCVYRAPNMLVTKYVNRSKYRHKFQSKYTYNTQVHNIPQVPIQF